MCNVGRSGNACGTKICGTENSLFDAKESRCLCEPGYTCCSAQKLAMLMNTDAGEVSNGSNEVSGVTGLEDFE